MTAPLRPVRAVRPSYRRVVVAGLVAAALLAVPGLRAQQREAREKHVFLAVTGKDDAPVPGMAANEFKIREDGVAREVLRVSQATGPLSIALLVDDSAIAQPAVNELRQGVAGFISQMLEANSQTEIMLMTFGDRPTVVVPATTSSTTLAQGVQKLFGRQGAGAYFMQAVSDAAKMLAKKDTPRRVIVAFDFEDGREFSNDSHESVTTALQNAKASLFTVALQESHDTPNTPEARERAIVLSDVASSSGGGNKALITRQAIPLGLNWVATLLISQYDVVYNRPEALIPPKKIDVETTRKDVRLWAPRWGLP